MAGRARRQYPGQSADQSPAPVGYAGAQQQATFNPGAATGAGVPPQQPAMMGVSPQAYAGASAPYGQQMVIEWFIGV